MKYVVRERKPIPFSWRFENEMKQKWKFVWEWHGEFERVSGKEEDEQLEMFEGKLKKFKNWPILFKTCVFRDWINSRASREQVANLSREKHETPNFWKIF